MTTVLHARPRHFVNTPAIERVITRALRYLQSGYPVHLRGPAGTGKTTLALHLADLLSRPIMLLFGDDEFKSTDLIGNQSGYTRKKVVDNFIHSVVKMEDELRHNWVDSRLTLACREGFTLVYDEFNRSRPEVNNVLLSALEEKLLVLPPNSNRNEYIRVNPHFRAIFTSNPEEYCGVHATQDALLDRLITINIPEPDELAQQEIIVQKIGIDRQSAATIVQLIRRFRQKVNLENSSGLRSCLMIAKICHEHGIIAATENAEFRDLCQDIMLSRSGLPIRQATQVMWETFNEFVGADIAPYEATDHPTDEDNPVEEKIEDVVAIAPAQVNEPSEDSGSYLESNVMTGTLEADPAAIALTESVPLIDTLDPDLDSFSEVPFERDVYAYLQTADSVRPSEIEAALGISRFQAINALRSLVDKGLILAETNTKKPSTYRLNSASTIVH